MKTWTPKQIKDFRKKHELSQPKFGRLMGVSGNYIYLLEKGVKTPGKTFKLLLDCIEEKMQGKQEREDTHGKSKSKRHI
jgi:DNA-binding transcriptional regulator YiaG